MDLNAFRNRCKERPGHSFEGDKIRERQIDLGRKLGVQKEGGSDRKEQEGVAMGKEIYGVKRQESGLYKA